MSSYLRSRAATAASRQDLQGANTARRRRRGNDTASNYNHDDNDNSIDYSKLTQVEQRRTIGWPSTTSELHHQHCNLQNCDHIKTALTHRPSTMHILNSSSSTTADIDCLPTTTTTTTRLTAATTTATQLSSSAMMLRSSKLDFITSKHNSNRLTTLLADQPHDKLARTRPSRHCPHRRRNNATQHHLLFTSPIIACLLVTLTLLISQGHCTLAAAAAAAASSEEPMLMANNKAEPLVAAAPSAAAAASSSSSSTSPNNNDKHSDQLQQQQPNVIIIKYANVTTSTKESGDDNTNDDANQQVMKYQLHNEPLSVSVIESKFSHSIQLFDVSYNQLSTLSKDLFCPLSNEVRQLNISHNLLENFDCLGLISQNGQLCLSELRILDMSFNLIKHLPATGVATLHNLEILNLSNNLIESLDELSLSSLFKLTRLDLSHNKIQQLPMRIFHKSSSMRTLKLQSNQLSTPINQMILFGLISIEELDLSYNNLSHVSELAFLDKPNLTRVDLSHNQLTGLRQEALRVTVQPSGGSLINAAGPGQAPSSRTTQQLQFKPRLHHNGQFAGLAQVPSQQQQQQAATSGGKLSTVTEFHLASNPFVCDCQLDWMRKFPRFRSNLQAPNNIRFADLTQNDQPQQQQQTVMQQPDLNNNNNNNNQISEIPAGSNGGQQHYGRIADLDSIKCNPLFRRNSQLAGRTNGAGGAHRGRASAGPMAPSDGHSSQVVHHPNNHLQQQQQQQHHLHHFTTKHQQHDSIGNSMQMIDLLTADPSNFLCRYKSHCFALCHCCEFDACDCEMICPSGCNCYYDSTWQTNIIDCSSNNHTVVPDRIPMDVSGLYLDGNNIDSLKPSNLIARKSLKTLFLNASNLQYIANKTFNGLIELQTLYLNDNQLRSLHGHEFEPLAQLRLLYLQSNRLEHINNQTFIYLRSLEILDLSNNRLTSMNLDLFMSIGHHNIRLRQLSIAHNWWSCQCSSINRFRSILKQKFLLTPGGVNILDRNQLRCYYNSTTVGPLILDSYSAGLSGVAGSSLIGQQQQPIFGSYPQLGAQLMNGKHHQHHHQQQQLLTEINQCSEIIGDERPTDDNNPPVIQAHPQQQQHQESQDILANGNPFDLTPPQIDERQAPFNQITGGNMPPQSAYPPVRHHGGHHHGHHHNQQQQPPSTPTQDYPPHDQPMFPPSSFGPGPMLGDIPAYPNGADYGSFHQQQPPLPPTQQQQTTMPLTSFVFFSVLCFCVLIVGLSIFVFVRQQQRFGHKKTTSAASTTSVSSSSSSSTSAKTRHNHHLHHHHHLYQQQQQQQHHTLSRHTLHHAHHQLSGQQQQQQQQQAGQPLFHHQLSASSQSNIYAALVSPTTTGSATIITSQGAQQSQSQQQQPLLAGNLYSSPSTAASYHSNTQQHQQHWHQQPLYGAYNGSQHLESPYYSASGVGGNINSNNNKGSALYSAAQTISTPIGTTATTIGPGQPSDWIKLAKVRQFVSKLVSKSLALTQWSSSGSLAKDELNQITSSDKIYDAFLSYDKRDEPFVMQHLSAELEYGQPQYRVADRYRDLPSPSSAYIAEAITSVISCSHRTIIVVTPNYLANDWCRFELRAALRESALDKAHKIIAILLDSSTCLADLDPELRALLASSSASSSSASNSSSSSATSASSTASQNHGAQQQNQQQLVQLVDSAPSLDQQQHLVATLTSQAGGQQQVVCTQTATGGGGASQRVAFVSYQERKFWSKLRQLMPVARPSAAQTLTLTTKN